MVALMGSQPRPRLWHGSVPWGWMECSDLWARVTQLLHVRGVPADGVMLTVTAQGSGMFVGWVMFL